MCFIFLCHSSNVWCYCPFLTYLSLFSYESDKVLVTQSCPTLCNPMDCSPSGSYVHGILQARILEYVAMPSSRGSSQLGDQSQVSHIVGWFFTTWAREALLLSYCFWSIIASWFSSLFLTLLRPHFVCAHFNIQGLTITFTQEKSEGTNIY